MINYNVQHTNTHVAARGNLHFAATFRTIRSSYKFTLYLQLYIQQ